MVKISTRGKVFRDPIHGLIFIESGDEFVLDLINTPEFQRLRRIRQLGLSSFTYPGAEHTRFAHSLGVFNFAQRILYILRRRYADKQKLLQLLDNQQQIVKAAALLHDIGHGPFSHLIERSFKSVADHEKKTVELIQNGGTITDCLKKHHIDPKSVANLIRKVSEYRFLVDIVSSQLDADRMDYILRDALNTGVKYGAFDSEWVLNNLCLGVEPKLKEKSRLQDLRLCLEDRRGLSSAEQIVMARMHMSHQVYFHRATRGWEAHLLCLLKLAAEKAKKNSLPSNTPSNFKQFLEKNVLGGDEWLWFDESTVEAALHAWARTKNNKELGDLSRAFLQREKVFNCAELGNLTTEKMLRLSAGLLKNGRENVDWLLDDPAFTSYKDFYFGFQGSKNDEMADSTSAILISNGDLQSVAIPAETVSSVLGALGDNARGNGVSLARLYYNKRLEKNVKKLLAAIGCKKA